MGGGALCFLVRDLQSIKLLGRQVRFWCLFSLLGRRVTVLEVGDPSGPALCYGDLLCHRPGSPHNGHCR